MNTASPHPLPGHDCLRKDASRTLSGMFRQVSGECGRRLQGSCQSGPQCPEESPEAEKTQDLPAAVTLGLTAPSGTVVARDPAGGFLPHQRPVVPGHRGLDSWNVLDPSPLGSRCSSMVNDWRQAHPCSSALGLALVPRSQGGPRNGSFLSQSCAFPSPNPVHAWSSEGH